MALPQESQNANGLAKASEVPAGKQFIFVDPDTNEGGNISIEDLQKQIFNNLVNQNLSLKQGEMTLIQALNQTNDELASLKENLERIKNQISGGTTDPGTSTTITLSGAGFGLGNTYSNPEGGAKNNYGTINNAFIKAIADAGFKFVRIIIDIGKNNWSAGQDNQQNYPDGYTGGTMDFALSPAWIAELKKLADLCKSNGLQLTICPFGWMVFWAQVQGTTSGYNGWGEYYWASPNNVTKAYCTAFLSRLWTQLAATFKEYDAVAFELVNEPLNTSLAKTNNLYRWRAWKGVSYAFGGSETYDSDDWDGTAQEMKGISAEAAESLAAIELACISVIRDTGAQNLILCPTYAQSRIYDWIDYINANVIKKSGDSNCAIAIHWYTPDNICGKNVKSGAVFDSTAQDYAGDTGDYTTGMAAIKKASNNNIPLVITEGSVCMSKARVADEERLKWATDINTRIIKKKIPFSLFDNGTLVGDAHLNQNTGEDYGVINRTTLAWSDPAMIQKIVS
ncbi:MAG: cellulase family glycosylhydrolase [Eubacteriales bacterium]|nr:cellulase family glycosylhydrolase [Eubacteriales bacterium]